MCAQKNGDLVSNRKAFHNYEIFETFEAGIALLGTEVKSLKEHSASLQEAYVVIQKDEALLKNASIMPYRFGNVFNHEERRDRKLLLHHYEIEEIRKATEMKGMTVIPLAMYLKKGKVKVKIGLAKGKKAHDKRHALRAKEEKKEIDRALKRHR